MIAIVLAAAAAAAGCDSADVRPPPAAAGAPFARCESPAGFTLARPRGWHTNPGHVVPRCSRLDPEPIELREGTDERRAAIVARIEDARFNRVAAPRDGERSRAMTTIDGLRAVRLELETSRPGLWPHGTRVTRYLVDLSPGTLILDTVGLDGFDYERNQTVLDDVARKLEVTREGVRTAPRVVARYGGSGAFRVLGTLRGGKACLRIPPDGSRRCADTPAADGVALPKLRPVLAGVAGPEVFRVTAVRR
jgi:hypothetical protein